MSEGTEGLCGGYRVREEVGGLLSRQAGQAGLVQLLNMKRRMETLSTMPSNVKFTTVALPP